MTGPTLGASRCGVMEILGHQWNQNFKQTNASVLKFWLESTSVYHQWSTNKAPQEKSTCDNHKISRLKQILPSCLRSVNMGYICNQTANPTNQKEYLLKFGGISLTLCHNFPLKTCLILYDYYDYIIVDKYLSFTELLLLILCSFWSQNKAEIVYTCCFLFYVKGYNCLRSPHYNCIHLIPQYRGKKNNNV